MVKNKTTNKQSIAIIVLSVLLVALLAVNITFAYFTAQGGTTNDQNIKFDTLTLDVTEGTWTMAESETETLDKIVPGCKINMAGTVALTGASAYLKVVFNVNATPASGKTLDDVAMNSLKSALGDALKAQTVSNWVQGVDGAWYCVVANDAGTVIDLTKGSVTIPLETTGNVWQGATIGVGYSVTAIQSAHVTVAGEDDTAKAASLKTIFDSVKADTGLVG